MPQFKQMYCSISLKAW